MSGQEDERATTRRRRWLQSRPPERRFPNQGPGLASNGQDVGIRNATVVGGPGSIQAVPPWAWTNWRAIARPSPVPPWRERAASARLNTSNACSTNAAGKPGPASCTRTTPNPSATSIATSTVDAAGVWRTALSVPQHPVQRLRVTVDDHRTVALQPQPHVLAVRQRRDGLDDAVGHLGEVDTQPLEGQLAGLQPDQDEQVLDHVPQQLHVGGHGSQVLGGAGGDAVLHRLDRGLQAGERGPEVVPDRGQQPLARGRVAVSFLVGPGELRDHLVERPGQRADLVGPFDVGVAAEVAVRDPVGDVGEPPQVAGERGRDARRDEDAESGTEQQGGDHQPQLGPGEEHRAGGGRDHAAGDDDGGDRNGEDGPVQRRQAAVDPGQAPAEQPTERGRAREHAVQDGPLAAVGEHPALADHDRERDQRHTGDDSSSGDLGDHGSNR